MRQIKGLSTAVNPLLTSLGDAAQAHNVDFSRGGIGSLSKRLGYDSISTIIGQDSIIAMFPVYYADGTQQLFVIVDPKDTGYGNIFVSNRGSVNIENDSLTKVWTYWGIQTPSNFAIHGDNVYIVNGANKGAVCSRQQDGTVLCREYPIRAPGEPTINPLSHPSGELNGEYIYRISSNGGSASGQSDGIVTTRIRVNNGRVRLGGFQFMRSDSIDDPVTNATLVIHRTKANPGPLRPASDSSFVVKNYILGLDEALWDTISFIDSIADAGYSDVLTRDTRYGRDSAGIITYRYGAPRYESAIDTTYQFDGAISDTAGSFGVFYGIPTQAGTLGVAYTCTFIDTATGIESDTGRSANFWVTTSDRSGTTGSPEARPYSYTFTLPKIPPSLDSINGITSKLGLVINLYRANILQVTRDTAFFRSDTITLYGHEENRQEVHDVWKDSLVVDTVITSRFYLLAQLSSSDTSFTDSVRYDELIRNSRIFSKPTPPSLLSNLMIHDGRLFGTQGSRVYWSRLLNGADTIQTWGQLNVLPINESDGDIGTAFFKKRGVIRYMKNRSTYNIFQPSGGIEWTSTELAGDFGCIAPLSVSSNRSGTYYLSNDGIILETEGLRRDRQIGVDLISKRIDNFEKLSFTTKQNAVGIALPNAQKYLLSIPSIDTTYVYDEKSGDLATWGFSFRGAFKYGAETSVSFTPGDTTYFFQDSSLLRFGTSETDNGAKIQSTWLSQPMLSDPTNTGYGYKQITKIATHLGITGSAFIFYTHSDGAGDSLGFTNVSGSSRVRMNGSYSPTFLDYALKITLNPITTNFTNNSITGIDLYWQPMNEIIIQ